MLQQLLQRLVLLEAVVGHKVGLRVLQALAVAAAATACLLQALQHTLQGSNHHQ
jgi:hypothetical protein